MARSSVAPCSSLFHCKSHDHPWPVVSSLCCPFHRTLQSACVVCRADQDYSCRLRATILPDRACAKASSRQMKHTLARHYELVCVCFQGQISSLQSTANSRAHNFLTFYTRGLLSLDIMGISAPDAMSMFHEHDIVRC